MTIKLIRFECVLKSFLWVNQDLAILYRHINVIWKIFER